MPTGYTQVSATALKDSTDALVSNATISFQPVSSRGIPISFMAGGGGQTIAKPVTAQVVNGAFTIQLADTTLTTPINVGYAVTVTDNLTGYCLLSAGYGCVQPFGPTWSFDTFAPNLAAQVTPQYGPPGENGTNGSNGANGSSAYQLAVASGFSGTEAQWLASLVGPGGQVNNASIISLNASRLTTGINVVNPDGWTVGYIDQGGNINAGTAYKYSPMLPVNGGGQMVAKGIPNISGSTGLVFRDVTGAFISCLNPVDGVPFNVPSNASLGRFTLFTAQVPDVATYLGYGTTIPTPQPNFRSYSTTETASLISSSIATAIAATELVDFTTLRMEAQLERNTNKNLLQPDPSFWRPGYMEFSTGIYSPETVPGNTHKVSPLIPCTPGGSIVSNFSIASIANVTGICFFAKDGVTFISGVGGTGLTIPAGTATPVPSAATGASSDAYYWCFTAFQGEIQAGYWAGNGTAVPVPTPSFAAYSATEIDTKVTAIYASIGTATGAPYAGKNLVVFGDSYTDLNTFAGIWQIDVAAKLGMNLSATYAKASRTYSPVPPAPGGAGNWALSDFTPGGTFSPSALATALANCDVAIIALGTNDGNCIQLGQEPIGAFTDLSSAATYAGAVRYMLEQISTANPLTRVFGMGPILVQQANGGAVGVYANHYTNATAKTVTDLTKAIYADFGFPYFEAAYESGFNGYNGVNNMLQADGLHPSLGATGGFLTLYSPYIQAKMLGFRPR